MPTDIDITFFKFGTSKCKRRKGKGDLLIDFTTFSVEMIFFVSVSRQQGCLYFGPEKRPKER